jgi:hypothetical protein
MSEPQFLPLTDETIFKLRSWKDAKGRRQVELVDADNGTVYFGPIPSPLKNHDPLSIWVVQHIQDGIESFDDAV